MSRSNTAAAPLGGWPGAQHGFSPLTGGQERALSGIISGNWVPFGLQSPAIHQYNVTMEREIGWQTAVRASYLGTLMHGLNSGVDYNMIPPSDQPFGTTTGDGVTPCTPDEGDCAYSASDLPRLPYPGLSDYPTAFGNIGHGRSNAAQFELTRRFSGGLTFNVAYTYLDQKSTAGDVGASSLGGTSYNQFNPERDYGMDAFTPRHRLITYGIFDTPIGRGRKFGTSLPRFADAVIGGWQLSWQAFAKSGTGFTPFWLQLQPGDAGQHRIVLHRPDGKLQLRRGIPAVGDGQRGGEERRPHLGFERVRPDAPGRGPVRQPERGRAQPADRAQHLRPEPGIRKIFKFGERVRAELGADANNVLNHPLFSPDNYEIGYLGSFTMKVNPTTLQPKIQDVLRNPDFDRLINSYPQEGIDSRRMIRLRVRITF